MSRREHDLLRPLLTPALTSRYRPVMDEFEFNEEKIQALERFDPGDGERHIEVKKTGQLVAVDTSFAGTLKGVGKA